MTTAIDLLENYCPREGNGERESPDRLRLAAIKLSAGDLEKLNWAVDLDYRDLLVWAGFGDDVQAHLAWVPNPPNDLE